jgi:glucokinase
MGTGGNTRPGSPAGGRFVGLDIGGTGMKGLLCAPDGTIVARDACPTEADLGFQAVMERILRLADSLVSGSEEPVVGIGMALAGNLRSREGVCVFSPNLPGWRNVNVARPILENIGIPFRMGNDANCAALAEHRFGAGRGTVNMLMLTLGTGVGGGIIIDGRLMLGPREGMGEVGHIIVDPVGSECGCGNHGCLEAMCGADGISSAARLVLQSGVASSMLEMADGDILAISPRIVADAAAEGDTAAIGVLTDIGKILGAGITTLCMVLDPDRVVIGGQIAKTGAPLFDPMRRTVAARARMVPFDAANIVPAELGGDAGALGAVALFDDDSMAQLQP